MCRKNKGKPLTYTKPKNSTTSEADIRAEAVPSLNSMAPNVVKPMADGASTPIKEPSASLTPEDLEEPGNMPTKCEPTTYGARKASNDTNRSSIVESMNMQWQPIAVAVSSVKPESLERALEVGCRPRSSIDDRTNECNIYAKRKRSLNSDKSSLKKMSHGGTDSEVEEPEQEKTEELLLSAAKPFPSRSSGESSDLITDTSLKKVTSNYDGNDTSDVDYCGKDTQQNEARAEMLKDHRSRSEQLLGGTSSQEEKKAEDDKIPASMCCVVM